MLSQEEAEEKLKEATNNEFSLISKYDGQSKYVDIQCANCGEIKNVIYCNFILRPTHCKCNINSRKNILKRHKHKELLDYCDNNELTLLSQYENANTKVLVKHNICSYEWMATPSNIKHGYGCPKCCEPKGEKEIRKILDMYNIKYITQYIFEDCVNIKPLKFDFYIPSQNICIEFQGEQHYKPIDIWGGEETFKINKQRDEIKRNYCKDNNIKLLEIKYHKINNIEKILIENNIIRKEE